jgi:small subunit ribosomal protein S6
METILNNYEMMLISPMSASDDALAASFSALQTAIESAGGSILIKDDWGRIRMAYAIRKQRVAQYFLLEYVAPSSVPLELERLVRFDDKNFLRFLTVCLDKNVSDIEALTAAASARAEARREKVASMKQENI